MIKGVLDTRGDWEDKSYKCLIGKVITIYCDNDCVGALLLYNAEYP